MVCSYTLYTWGIPTKTSRKSIDQGNVGAKKHSRNGRSHVGGTIQRQTHDVLRSNVPWLLKLHRMSCPLAHAQRHLPYPCPVLVIWKTCVFCAPPCMYVCIFVVYYHRLWCRAYQWEQFCQFALVGSIIWLPYLHDLFWRHGLTSVCCLTLSLFPFICQKCSWAHTISCLWIYLSFTSTIHPDMMCSIILSKCLQSLHLLSVSVCIIIIVVITIIITTTTTTTTGDLGSVVVKVLCYK